LTKIDMTVVSHPTKLSWLGSLQLFSVSCHIDAIEVIEAESQSVMNTPTEHDFQDAFKNGRSAGNSAYMWTGITSRVTMASRPKFSFWPDGRTSLGNVDDSLCSNFYVEIMTSREIDATLPI
jgi:hypothetical protein